MENLIKLIAKGESQTLEFKESFAQKEKILETICAFANTKGGTVLVGVSDKGEIIGTVVGKGTLEKIPQKIKENFDTCVFPSINVEEVEGKNVVAIEVHESHEKPVFFRDAAYKRVGKANSKISASEIRKLAKDSGEKVYWDEMICESAAPEDIDEGKVRWYLEEREKARNISKEIKMPVRKFMQNIGAMKGDKPTNAGILFFGEYPQRFFPNARLRVVKFKGTKITHPTLDTANCEGTIWEIVNTAEDFIRKNIRLLGTRTEKSFRREDKFEYPIKALREAILNAMIHRDYGTRGDVRVFIFDDRIEIINPGIFPEGVTPENPEHEPRNEVLCIFVYDIGYIEKYGSGIYLMNDLCRKSGNKVPGYDFSEISTKVIFESPIRESTYIEFDDLTDKLNDRQKKALYFAQKKRFITRREYIEINDISHETAHKELSEMVDKGFLTKEGKGRGVKYIPKT